MRLELTGRHVAITPQLRRLVDAKLAKLERLLNDRAVSAQAVLTRERYQRRTDITLHARGEKFLHGNGMSATWDVSVAEAVDKISQQAQKIKGKWQERKRRGLKGATTEGRAAPPAAKTPRASRERVRMPRILRMERQPIASMSVADALRTIGRDGDAVLIFRDIETAGLSVLYRRNGELTLVETEA